MIIGTLGFPLLFQSTWSFVPAGLSVIALLVRTHLEDFVDEGAGRVSRLPPRD